MTQVPDENSRESSSNPDQSGAGAENAGSKISPESLSLTDQLQAAISDRDAWQQKWLLAVADFDTTRRRIQKDAEQERKYAPLPLVKDLLPALDNLQRALEAARVSQDAGKLIEGVQMVAKQFDDVLAKHSILPINAVDKPFDPNLHQAVQQLPSDKPPMTVIVECERGYTMHDRVVRPSTVIVSAPSSE